MKKVLSAVLAASMVASLAACGSSSTPEATTAAAAAGDTLMAVCSVGHIVDRVEVGGILMQLKMQVRARGLAGIPHFCDGIA